MPSSGTAALADELQRMIEMLTVSRNGLVGDDATDELRASQLLARLRALGGESAPDAEDQVALGELSIDFAGHEVRVRGAPVHLTHREFSLLALLVRRRGRVCRREQIVREIWSDRRPASTRTIDIHVYRLRTKLAPLASAIDTVRGVGYIFRQTTDGAPEERA